MVLTVDEPFTATMPANCTADGPAQTITCDFGPLPAGSTATASPVLYLMHHDMGFGQFSATATRTASTPLDPNPGNDSAVHDCHYLFTMIQFGWYTWVRC